MVADFHNYDKPAIGRTVEVAIGKDYIASKMEFAPKGMNPEADILHDLYKSGFQNAASIGFMPLSDGDEEGDELNADGGYNFTKWELFEYSLVLVPDNPEALTIMRNKGLDPVVSFRAMGNHLASARSGGLGLRTPSIGPACRLFPFFIQVLSDVVPSSTITLVLC